MKIAAFGLASCTSIPSPKRRHQVAAGAAASESSTSPLNAPRHALTPSQTRTAPRQPSSAARRRISAIAGPGEAEISTTATTNAGSSTIRSTAPSSAAPQRNIAACA